MRVLSGAALTASRRLSTSPATEEYLWRGAATNWRVWFDDSGDPLDLSGFTSLTLTIADSPASNSETLATDTVLAASFGTATLSQFAAGTHQHATFSLSSDQTEITTSGVPSRTLYWQITGIASGETVRLGEGYIQLHGNGDSGPADPVSSYYTKAEVDSLLAGLGRAMITRVSDTGVRALYFPASDTDTARGEALATAALAMAAGETLTLSAGTYRMQGIGRIALSEGGNLCMDPGAIIVSDADLNADGCVIYPGNNSRITGGTITTIAADGGSLYCAAIGVNADIGDSARTGVVVENVRMTGDTDCFYIQHSDPCSAVLKNCTMEAKWDTVMVSNGGAHAVDIYGCRMICAGGSAAGLSTPGDTTRGVVSTHSAVVRVFGGSITCSGGTATNSGGATLNNGTLEMHGVRIVTSGTGAADLRNPSGGTLRVSDGAGSGSAGIWVSSGTITHLSGTA